ncbi:anthranilate phosphoribosyltransferase [Eupransor demetentiae]|uniref:Anthranilate phosphoribosyltransferase n=1 Tax=Eupransor demetentiae TaxID=3109584 RepID=A0ABM9N3Y5_9LACO|nr:Anthranilate phosphoribosyltransferase [Lactobacillaceae bacterium LMG 33000]
MSNIQTALKTLSLRQDLSQDLAREVMNDIMSGQVKDPAISAYLMGLAVKNESIPEITGSAQAMLAHTLKIPAEPNAIDIVGTGGDMANTFNISTTASFILAAAGLPVSKHGNRAASSKSGTADALEALGIKIDLSPEEATQLYKKAGQTFLFARTYHPAMKYVAGVRKDLGIRTVFNVLGPLTNPTHPKQMLMGVYSRHLLKPLAQVLKELGMERAILVNGDDGLDEVSLTGKSHLAVLKDGQIEETIFDPADYGFSYCQLSDLAGGTPAENAQITADILTGKITGPKRDIVVLNAALAIYLGQKADSVAAAIKLAQEILDSGAAAEQLNKVRRISQEVSQ